MILRCDRCLSAWELGEPFPGLSAEDTAADLEFGHMLLTWCIGRLEPKTTGDDT